MAALVVFAASALAKPPIFSDKSYDEALKQSTAEDKLLVVDATASWCGPCQMMDRDTWVSPNVESWMKEHAIAVQIDVDDESDLAEQLRIMAMPTIIVFRDGKEFGRQVGYRKPAQLLPWLEAANNGHTLQEERIARAGGRADADGNVDVDARMELAASLVEDKMFEQATEEYSWLWEHMLEFDPSQAGVRSTFLLRRIQQLIALSPSALERFCGIRDALEAKLKAGNANWDDLYDWVDLNSAVQGDDRTLAWIDRNIADQAGRSMIRRVGYRVRLLLATNKRWKDLGMIAGDPEDEATQTWISMKDRLTWFRSAHPDEVDAYEAAAMEGFRGEMAGLHANLVLADRTADARRLVDVVRALDDSVEMHRAIISTAIERDAVYPELTRLAPDNDEALRKQLDDAIQKHK